MTSPRGQYPSPSNHLAVWSRGDLFARALARALCALAMLLLVPAGALFAAAPDVALLRARVAADRALLAAHGKEAYLDHLFLRMDREVAATRARLERSPGDPDVRAARLRALGRALRDTKAQLAGLSAADLAAALAELDRWLALGRVPADARASSIYRRPGWVERFFDDTTRVRNFLITATTLSALGTGVGIAAVSCSTAPLVPVIGGLIGLVALLNQGPPHARL